MKSYAHVVAAVTLLSICPHLFAAEDGENKVDLPLTNQLILMSLDDAQNKVLQLADAIPEDKYGYTPMEGVADVGEVLIHLAGANYYIANLLGNPFPTGINPRELGQDADKAEMKKIYQGSVKHLHKAIEMVSEEAMQEEIEFFGMTAPRARLALIAADHQHEHLGQLIAYARANYVVPPWSH